ncbi:hypothetical protein [Thermogutta sp.]|uniref:hypothetical protein n=1 Tax=Thermogutta sp. TaxID=1962930 RepID=UPI00321FA1FF
MLPRVRRDVPQPHGVFEHLPGVAQALVNGRRPQAAPLHRRTECLAVGVGQTCQGAWAELLGETRRRLAPGQQGRGLVPRRPLALQPARQELTDRQLPPGLDQPRRRQLVT